MPFCVADAETEGVTPANPKLFAEGESLLCVSWGTPVVVLRE